MMMVIYIKQHWSNIWSWIHKKVKQQWGRVEKKRCLYKKRVIQVLDRYLIEQVCGKNIFKDQIIYSKS